MASYQCDRCLKRFSSYYNVRRHTANHCAYAKIDDNASMEGGGSCYSDEQSVDSFPDEKNGLRKLRKMKTVRIPKMMVK